MSESFELYIILVSALIVLGILIYNPAKYLGIPGFIIFLSLGLFLGNGTWGDPIYDQPRLTETLGTLALNVIIFYGGYNSSWSSIKAVWKEGLMLSTIGVLLTTSILGIFVHLTLGLPIITSLLFSAIVSSTDAASVFSILESKQIQLKENTVTTLEFESATNDPMALILLTIFTTLALNQTDVSLAFFSISFLKMTFIGAISGVFFGFITKYILERVNFSDAGLIPIFLIAMFLVATFTGQLLGGNLLLSAYIFGVISGNAQFEHKSVSESFTHSLSWLAQAIMYFFLGLQLFPDKLAAAFFISLLPAIFIILVARPLAVLLTYLPFRKTSFRKKLFISAIGLKGATPIVFAITPVLAGVDGARLMFNMVFFVVIISIIVQGALIKPLAKKLELIE